MRNYSPGLKALLRYSVTDQFIIEDLQQETLRIALEKVRRGNVREPERLSGFICGIARNLIVEHFRRRSHERAQAALDAAVCVTDPTSSPMQRLTRQENARITRKVLSEVRPVRYQDILYRYYLAEEPKEQICLDLGMNSLQFNRVLHRARERYRELYMGAMANRRSDVPG